MPAANGLHDIYRSPQTRENTSRTGIHLAPILLLTLALSMTGCASIDLPATSSHDVLVYDINAVERAEKLAVVVPGALASIGIFDPIAEWDQHGYALVYYRFPGLDGLPLDHRLDIDVAATTVANFLNAHPDKPARLLGYSTGAPIVLVASTMLQSSDVKTAAMSPAVPRGGGFPTMCRTSRDVFLAGLRAWSWRPEKVWPEYYRTLLFGRAGRTDKALRPTIDKLVEQDRENIIIPNRSLGAAHSDGLREWEPSPDLNLDAQRVRFYFGDNDPVFSQKQTQKFAQQIGITDLVSYGTHGHLLFITHPEVFSDILAFFEEPDRQAPVDASIREQPAKQFDH